MFNVRLTRDVIEFLVKLTTLVKTCTDRVKVGQVWGRHYEPEGLTQNWIAKMPNRHIPNIKGELMPKRKTWTECNLLVLHQASFCFALFRSSLPFLLSSIAREILGGRRLQKRHSMEIKEEKIWWKNKRKWKIEERERSDFYYLSLLRGFQDRRWKVI